MDMLQKRGDLAFVHNDYVKDFCVPTKKWEHVY